MKSLFDELSRGVLQDTVSGLVSGDLTAIPSIESDGRFKEHTSDPERDEKQFSGKISLIEKTEKLDGQRRGGELSGFINFSQMDAELWISCSEYEALEYDLKVNDLIQDGIAETGDQLYKIVEPHRGPHGEFFCGLVKEA